MKILLVDDNKYILNSLKQGIDYSSLGFEEVYTARSLEGAAKILREERIQAVLTDIEMPNGTGLELLELINANWPDIVTVFCTSYADFGYARRALELHSFDYYLKPIRYDDLYRILERVVSEIKRRSAEKEKKKLGDYWLNSLEESRNYFWTEILILNYDYAEEELEELAASRHLDYRNEDRYLLGVLELRADKEAISKMRYSDKQFVLKNILNELLAQGEMKLEALIKNDNDTWVLVISEKNHWDDASFEREMNRVLGNVEGAMQCSAALLYDRNNPLMECRNSYLELEQAFRGREKEEGTVTGCTRLEHIELSDFTEGNERALTELKRYLDSHYNEKISQEEIAGEVYYNLAYITKLFKKKYGMTPGNYVLERRIQRAKELLLREQMSVSEIALEVGYDNFAYFSRLFKKKTGYAPKDYREAVKSTK